jgi:hypothetical protein
MQTHDAGAGGVWSAFFVLEVKSKGFSKGVDGHY